MQYCVDMMAEGRDEMKEQEPNKKGESYGKRNLYGE
jgi:hypothetical protein